MKDSYVADIGDFMKYGLLKALCSSDGEEASPPLTLGVIWYLFPDSEKNNDGKFVQYLDVSDITKNKAKLHHFKRCDEVLHLGLQELMAAAEKDPLHRCVASVRERQLLPASTTFYEKPLTFAAMLAGTPRAIKERLDKRAKWLNDAKLAIQACDVIFVDPDNGLEVSSTKSHHNLGPKYVFFDELQGFIDQQKTVIIYQHKNRQGSVQEQIDNRVRQLKEKMGYQGSIFSLYFANSGGRIFFVLPAVSHDVLLSQRIQAFHKKWQPYVELR